MERATELPARRLPPYIGLLTLLLLGVFAWAPATYPGYWLATDGFVPVFNAIDPQPLAHIASAPDLWRGLGGGAFWLAQPLLALGFAPVAAVRASFAVAIVLGGLGVYAWLLPRWGDVGAGLGGLLYTLLPPLLATVYIRGSLADATVLALLPMALAGLAACARARREQSSVAVSVVVIVASVLWLWRAQPGLALLATGLLLLYALIVERSVLATLVALASGLVGALSLLPQWSVRAPSTVNFSEHFVYPHQLFSTGWQNGPSVPGWQDGFPFQLGLVPLGLAVLTLWFWWLRRAQADDVTPSTTTRLLIFCAAGTLLLATLSLGISAPLWQISGSSRLLTYPWQIGLLALPLLAATAAGLVAVEPNFARPATWVALLAVVVLGSYPYLTTRFTQVQPPHVPVAVVGNNQLVLLEAKLSRDVDKISLTATWQVLQPLPVDYNVFFQALAERDGKLSVLNQLDTQPLDGLQPATTWQPGQIYSDTYTLDLNAAVVNTAEEPLRFDFGFYDWRDGTRLSVTTPLANEIDDKLVLHE